VTGAALHDIGKYFPQNGVEALSGASFDLRPGEIHALVGENGAGKSTLMHVLAGHLEPSSGTITVDGAERRFAAPADALAAGIGLVRQHPRTVPGFALWEDCVLGAEPGRGPAVSRAEARRTVHELSCRWGFDLDADARTDTLTVSQRQKAAVLALLMRGVRYFLLDEPTAVLAPAETERLFALLSALRAEGKAIVLISHKLPETLAIADRVTVLRRGRVVGTREAAALDAEELGRLMFGTDDAAGGGQVSDSSSPRWGRTSTGTAPGRGGGDLSPSKPPRRALSVRGLVARPEGRAHLRGVDLELDRGRILGVAGVRDSGLETLEYALAGLIAPEAGEIELNGVRVGGRGAAAAREAGAAYVPADRLGAALAPRLPLTENLTVHAFRRRRGLVDPRSLRRGAEALMRAAKVAGDPRRAAQSFSGGTLQKLILEREFAQRPELLILAEPGWGLDARSRSVLDDRLRRFADEGRSIVLLSTDLDELLSLADTIATLRDGFVSGLFENDGSREDLREAVGTAMVGTEACLDR
jgi:simple sugar transport system ATP-binding protein